MLLRLFSLFPRFPLLLLKVSLTSNQPGAALLYPAIGRGNLHRLRHGILYRAEVVRLLHGSAAYDLRHGVGIVDELRHRRKRAAVLFSSAPFPGDTSLGIGLFELVGDLAELAGDLILPAVDHRIDRGGAPATGDLLVLLRVIEPDVLHDLVAVAAIARRSEVSASSADHDRYQWDGHSMSPSNRPKF
ncbi:hypothetical protein [Saccharopolyspora sp. CA-218241]|uniref:hypothetical protein n=1 Tax=Saccharopolyspora sp. CA-218241 TaxID=3240027 RepID=UPI003D990E60